VVSASAVPRSVAKHILPSQLHAAARLASRLLYASTAN
jgi:hypothetical protein